MVNILTRKCQSGVQVTRGGGGFGRVMLHEGQASRLKRGWHRVGVLLGAHTDSLRTLWHYSTEGFKGGPEIPRTSCHYSTTGLKGGPQSALIPNHHHLRSVIRSESRSQKFQSGKGSGK